jgi:hypothetical protein
MEERLPLYAGTRRTQGLTFPSETGDEDFPSAGKSLQFIQRVTCFLFLGWCVEFILAGMTTMLWMTGNPRFVDAVRVMLTTSHVLGLGLLWTCLFFACLIFYLYEEISIRAGIVFPNWGTFYIALCGCIGVLDLIYVAGGYLTGLAPVIIFLVIFAGVFIIVHLSSGK